MIGKVTRGRDLGGLLRYLFGPGRANEHTRPHLVASWRGEDTSALADLGPIFPAGRADVADLTARMLLPLQLQPDVDRPVWQCSMRTAPGDRILTDAEWAAIARDVLHRTGFAPHGDAAACRWVAVRHADDHIHLAVVLARMDAHPVAVFRDWPKVHAAARAAERRLGLQSVTAPGRATGGRCPTRAEHEKTRRTASGAAPVVSSRRWLTEQTRAAAAAATSVDDFAAHLATRGVLVTWRRSHRDPTQVTGYAVARPGDHDPTGHPIWFGGSKLAADLSLPRLTTRWQNPPASPGAVVPGPERVASPADNPGVRAAFRAALRLAWVIPGNQHDQLRVGANVARLIDGVRKARLARLAPGHRGSFADRPEAGQAVGASESLRRST